MTLPKLTIHRNSDGHIRSVELDGQPIPALTEAVVRHHAERITEAQLTVLISSDVTYTTDPNEDAP